MQETLVWFLDGEDLLKGLATHSRILGLHLWLSWYRICLQCGRPGFDPWFGKIPWRRERLPNTVLWPGKFHGLYSPWGSQSGVHNWATFYCWWGEICKNEPLAVKICIRNKWPWRPLCKNTPNSFVDCSQKHFCLYLLWQPMVPPGYSSQKPSQCPEVLSFLPCFFTNSVLSIPTVILGQATWNSANLPRVGKHFLTASPTSRHPCVFNLYPTQWPFIVKAFSPPFIPFNGFLLPLEINPNARA